MTGRQLNFSFEPTWHAIVVGCGVDLVDGKAIKTFVGIAHPLDPLGAAEWLDANLPAVLAVGEEAHRLAAAYAVFFGQRARRLELAEAPPPIEMPRRPKRTRRVRFTKEAA